MSRSTARAIEPATDRLRDESLQLLKRLILAGKDGTAAVDGLVEDTLRAVGCETDVFTYDPRAVPLIGEFATETLAAPPRQRCVIGRVGGTGGGRSLLLFAHSDTEEPRSRPAWTTDPFAPAVRDGRIYGWGVADDLAGIAMMIQSVAVLRSAGLKLAGDVFLVCAPSKNHRRGISAALHRGLSADAAVYLHPAESGRGLDEIKAFTPGQLEFTITIRGRAPGTSEPAHTAFAHRAVSAFDKAMIVASALHRLDAERGDRANHPALQRAIGRSANLMLSFCEFGDEHGLGRLAETCRLGGALTLLPSESLSAVTKAVESTIRAAAESDPWLRQNPPEVAWLAGVSGAETAESTPLYQTVARALRNSGAAPQVNPLHTSSDIRNPIVQKGIATVGFGPLCGGLTMSGDTDEWVAVDDFHRAVRAAAEIACDWCGLAPPSINRVQRS